MAKVKEEVVEKEVTELKEKVKFAKNFFNKEDGEYQFAKRKTHLRDFGATRMTLPDLERGVKRANKRFKKTGNVMYKNQAQAYEDRVVWYTT
jgi:hypothetical protein